MKQRWEDCTIGFYCPNCNNELVADSQNGAEQCECGLVYSLVAYVKITPPNNSAHPTPESGRELPAESNDSEGSAPAISG